MNVTNQINKSGDVDTYIYIDDGMRQIGYVKLFVLKNHSEFAKRLESLIKREIRKYEKAR